MSHHVRLLGALVMSLALAACASKDQTYTFVWLRTGPNQPQPEEAQTLFRGHMNNIRRLAEEGSLLVAGPYASPSDRSWRGLFVFKTAQSHEAEALVATDPAVHAGVFVADMEPITASAALSQTSTLYKAFKAKREANPEDTAPDVRAYVILTAQDAARAAAALTATGLAPDLLWHGRFAGKRSPGGVFVLNALDPAPIRERLSAGDPGPCAIDGWWASAVLVDLPPDCRKLR